MNDLKEKAHLVWNHYLTRTLNHPLEPKWIHSGYELVRDFSHGLIEKSSIIEKIIESHFIPDGTFVSSISGRPNTPQRMIHDGWKAGSPSWIFMGRNTNQILHLGFDWVVIGRTMPENLYHLLNKSAPRTLWMAYNLSKPFIFDSEKSNIIGPAIAFEQIYDAVNFEVDHRLYSIGASTNLQSLNFVLK